jgi:hypothetical protein
VLIIHAATSKTVPVLHAFSTATPFPRLGALNSTSPTSRPDVFVAPMASLDQLDEIDVTTGEDACKMAETEGVWDTCRPESSIPGLPTRADTSDESSFGGDDADVEGESGSESGTFDV